MGGRKLSLDEKELILNLYNRGYNTVYIGEKLGRSSSGIQRFLKNEGIELKPRRTNITVEEIENICNLYKQGKSTEELAKMYIDKVKSGNTIASILRDNGVEVRPRNYTLIKNEDFFEDIDTQEKAYILGLIIADGCVVEDKRENRQPEVSITLHQDDKYLLEQIKEIIGADSRKLIEHREEVRFGVTSRKMADDLSKYGVVPRKSHISYLPIIREDLMPHLIRGIFDGDGTVYTDKYLHFGFYGSNRIVNEIKKYLVNAINISDNKVTDKGTVSLVYFSKPIDAKAFYDLIYTDATIFLKRKKDKFESRIEGTEVIA